jgi:hypothetical protein
VTPNRRARVAGLVVTIAAIPFFLPTAAGATATLGQSNEWTAPPAPSACAGFLWRANPPKALSTLDTRFVIPGLTLQPGTIDVTEVVAWDGRSSNEQQSSEHAQSTPAAEKNEQLRIEYWKGDTMLAATTATPDLLDDQAFAWVVTPLGQVDIFETADRVEIVHSSQFMATDGTENSFYPKSVCITTTPHEVQTTTTVQQVTTTAPTTTVQQVVTTVPPTTVPPTTVPTEVLAETVLPAAPQQPVLARTGDQSAKQAGIGVALLGFGAGLVYFGRRRKPITF